MPSFSLVGALEFRSIISSLQQDSAGYSLSAFETPLTPYPGGHYHNYNFSRSRSRASIYSGSAHTWDTSSDVPLDDRSPLPPTSSLPPDDSDVHPAVHPTEPPLSPIGSDAEPQIPEIAHIPASPLVEISSDVAHHMVAARPRGTRFVLARASHILFPTLHGFHAKSLLGKATAVLATPAVFALTITLPVVVEPYDSAGYRFEKASTINDTLITLEGDGIERVLIDKVEDEAHSLQFNKWLMALQCTLGPLFCVVVLFSTLIIDPPSEAI
jgi:solute carrier family 24 (sodium/potassium/calcium exchanger), member 6